MNKESRVLGLEITTPTQIKIIGWEIAGLLLILCGVFKPIEEKWSILNVSKLR